mgnify:CR=1 FL=1
MKKVVASVLFLSFFAFHGASFAVTPEEAKEARFKEVKAIKEKQRLEREAEKKNPSVKEKGQPGFWEKEGERSGLGGSGTRTGNFLKNLNPVPFFKEQKEKYEARKAGTIK